MADKKSTSKKTKSTASKPKEKAVETVEAKAEVIEIKEEKKEAQKEQKTEAKAEKPCVFVKKLYKNVCHAGATFTLRSGQDLSGDPGLIYQLKTKGIEFVSDRNDCV